MEVSADLQELVDRRGALRARMLELRAQSPEDHDGFLRTVDQLLAVSNRIVEIVSAPSEAGSSEAAASEATPAEAGQGRPETTAAREEGDGAGGDGDVGSAIEGGADQAAAGAAEDDAG